MNSPLRILVCTNLFPPHSIGGSEIVAYRQSKVFQSLGHEVRVFSGRLANSPMHTYRVKTQRGEFTTSWVSLWPEDLDGRTQRLGNERIRGAFGRVLDKFSPDVVHFHNITGLSIGVIDECVKRRVPTVMTLHDYWGICFKNLMIKNDGSLCMKGGFDCLGCLEVLSGDPPLPTPVRNAHLLLALLKVDRFISPSQYLAQRFIDNGIPAERMVVIRYGIDLEALRPAPRGTDGVTVGYVGQLVKHKGVDVFLRALALLGNLDPLRVLIVGDGEEAGSLRSLCGELELDRRVTFSGRVDNRLIGSYYERIDLLVVPSVWPENSPVTITEAMASGIPVIASDMGGMRELVENGVTGLLVPPGDVGALAEKIEYLVRQPQVRRQMGENARERIKEHELARQGSRVLEVYGELLDPGRRSTRGEFETILYHSHDQWDAAVRELVYELAGVEAALGRRLLLCRIDLSSEEIMRSAKVLLIPSAGPDSFLHALRAFVRGLPILVREDSPELRGLCLASDGGLFYSGPDELRECMKLLLSNEPLREAMGRSGRGFALSARASP